MIDRLKRMLDMRRGKRVRRFLLTLYRDFSLQGRDYRGCADLVVHPGQGPGELKALVGRGLEAAALVRNEPFPLPEPGAGALELPQSRLASGTLESWLLPLTEALFREDRCQEGGLNTGELFLSRVRTRVLNSQGVDATYTAPQVFLEFISEWRGREEFELYRSLSFADFQPDWIARSVREQLLASRDRASASPTPRLKALPVLLSGEPVSLFLRYYLERASAQMVYQKLSTARLGCSLQGEKVSGDTLTLRLVPFLPNSPHSSPCDEDGFPLRETVVAEEGILRRYLGPLHFTHYLGVEPTGDLKNMIVLPGGTPAQELRGEDCLEVVSFSDFQYDGITGDFGGEIRLAYCRRGGRRFPVSGGSISGTVREVEGSCRFSRETRSQGGFSGPETIRLLNVRISGAQ